MKGSILFLTLFLIAVSAQADPRQWDHAGIPLRRAYQVEWDRTVALRADGYSLVVWSDRRAGNRQIVAQLINPAGRPAWANGGVVVVSRPGVHRFPAACASTGGWIIAWQCFPFGFDYSVEGPSQVWAQKLNDVGGLVWDAAGVPVDTSANLYIGDKSIHLVQDAAAGAIIAWDTYSGGVGNVYAQHLTLAGARDWANTLAVTNTNHSSGSSADGDGHGDMLITWEDERIVNNRNIYAAKITPQAELPWGSGVNGILVCGATGRQYRTEVCADGQRGCYIVWQDERSDVWDDLFMQRLNESGQVQWQTDGIALCVASYPQRYPQLAVSMNSGTADGCLAVWEDARVNANMDEVYAQKVSPLGAEMWTANGMKICGDAGSDSLGPTGHTSNQPCLASDLSGGLICAWEDTRNSDNDRMHDDVYAGRVLANGTLTWSGTSGVVVANGPDSQDNPVIASDNNGAMVVYQDAQNNGQGLRSQKLAMSNGGRLLPDTGVVVVTGLNQSGRRPLAIAMSSGRVACVWEDYRGQDWYCGLRYQILDNLGHAQEEANGAPIAPDNEGYSWVTQDNAQLCSDGSGGFFVVWQDLRTGTRQIRIGHVNAAGNILTSPEGIVVFFDAATMTDQGRPYCAPDGVGGCFVAWSNYDREYYVDAYVMRVSSEGFSLWPHAVRLTNTHDDDIIYGLVPTSDGGCIVVWKSGQYLDYNITVAKIRGDATVTCEFDVCDAPNNQDDPAIVTDGQGGAYLGWLDNRSSVRTQNIYVQHLTAQGVESWVHNGVPAAVDTSNTECVLALSPDGDLFVAWVIFGDNGGQYNQDVYAQKIAPTGERLWPDSGLVVCDAPGGQNEVAILPDNGAGLFVAWRDPQHNPSDRCFATHLDGNGNPVGDAYWQLHSGGVLTDSTLDAQQSPVLASDGAGGFVAFWNQFSASDGWELSDICAQHVSDAAGTNEHPSALPKTYALSQNYPNPFNPTTVIAFALPKSGMTTLRVYDILGRQVSTLVDWVTPAGNHSVSFDASRLASGIYFYRLESRSFSRTRKMVLLK